MKLKYTQVILIVILSLIVNQLFIQYWLAQKEHEATVINVAGRQRMLSQKINLEIYKVVHDDVKLDQLQALYQEWTAMHFNLLNGNDKAEIPVVSSPEIRPLLMELSPKIQLLNNFVTAKEKIQAIHLPSINKNQADFLKQMNAIVNLLEVKAEKRLQFIRIMEVLLMLLTMAIILLEIFFFYLPLNRQKDKAIADLEQNNRELNNILDNSNDAIIYRDIKTQEILKCNKKLFDLVGVNTLEALNKIEANDFLPTEPVTGMPKGEFLKALNQSLKEKGRYENEIWINNVNGEKIRIKLVSILEKVTNQNPRIISFEQDITQAYHAREAIKNKNVELKKYIESNLYLSKFAAMASHDLQAPLRTIASFTSLLQESAQNKLSDEEKEYMTFIKRGAKNLQLLVTDLLSLSSIENRKPQFIPINPTTLLTQICQELTVVIQEKKARIEIQALPTTLFADYSKLRQIFQNLITNGIKFSQKNQTPVVLIGGQTIENGWEFFVKDNGIGIAEEYQEKIFNFFTRLHSRAEFEGTGIGLAMVKKLVDQHEGIIRLVSTVGVGSTFYFTIKKQEVTLTPTENKVPKFTNYRPTQKMYH